MSFSEKGHSVSNHNRNQIARFGALRGEAFTSLIQGGLGCQGCYCCILLCEWIFIQWKLSCTDFNRYRSMTKSNQISIDRRRFSLTFNQFHREEWKGQTMGQTGFLWQFCVFLRLLWNPAVSCEIPWFPEKSARPKCSGSSRSQATSTPCLTIVMQQDNRA